MARPITGTANFGAFIMGFDFWGTVYFTFHPGRPAAWCSRIGTWDPPEPEEIEMHGIVLQRDEPGRLGPAWAIDGAMFDVISELTSVYDAICEEVGRS